MLILYPEGQLRSGKNGSLVFSKRGYVSPLKLHSTATNAATSKVRFRFSEINIVWRLSCRTNPAFKVAWNATQYSDINTIGNRHILSGKAAFIRVNQYLFQSNQLPTILPPVNAIAPSVRGFNIVAHASALQLKVGMNIDVNNHSVNVYASAPLSAGVRNPDGSVFRKIGTFDYSALTSINVYTQYIKKFGYMPAGSLIAVLVQSISNQGVVSIRQVRHTVVNP